MDLTLIRLAPTTTAAHRQLSPELIVDVLWATAIPNDRLEHVRARQGTDAGSVDLALFQRASAESTAGAALDLCRRAIRGSPALAGWNAQLIKPPDATTEIVSAAHRGDGSTNPKFDL